MVKTNTRRAMQIIRYLCKYAKQPLQNTLVFFEIAVDIRTITTLI